MISNKICGLFCCGEMMMQRFYKSLLVFPTRLGILKTPLEPHLGPVREVG